MQTVGQPNIDKTDSQPPKHRQTSRYTRRHPGSQANVQALQKIQSASQKLYGLNKISNWQAGRQTDRQAVKPRQGDGKTGRQAHKQTGRQTDRKAGRHTKQGRQAG